MQVIDFTAEVVREFVSPIPPIELPQRSSALRSSSGRGGGKRRRRGKGRIRARSARIFWSHHPQTHRVTDVFVSTTDQPAAHITAEYESQRWVCVVGNCDAAWLKDPAFTPEAVFGEMLEAGFHSRHDLVNALHQFARIDTCGWAQAMLDRLGSAS